MTALKKKLRKQNDDVRFIGIGGSRMKAQGLETIFPNTDLMVMGFTEVLKHLPNILKKIRITKEKIIELHPDALISIDFPDFSFRVASQIAKYNRSMKKKRADYKPIKIIHQVAPSVWIWRKNRAKKVAKFLDHLLALLPFEPPYFTKEGLPCTFTGHPVIQSGMDKGDGDRFRTQRNIPKDKILLLLLPGSRESEVKKLLPVLKQSVRLLRIQHPKLELVIPVVEHLKNYIENEVSYWGVPHHIVDTSASNQQEKCDAFKASNAAIAASGTVSLELAMAQVPSVIVYKLSNLTALIAAFWLKNKFVSLVNILNKAPITPELLQFDCTPENISNEISTLLSREAAREAQILGYQKAIECLGIDASEKAAEVIINWKRKPIVLQVLPALVSGGVERGTVDVAKALEQSGINAIAASNGGGLVHSITKAGGTHVQMPLNSKNPVTIINNGFKLAHLIKSHKIDVIHARSRAPAWSALIAAKLTHIPFITTFHNAYGTQNKFKYWYNSVMAKGDSIIAISQFVKDYIIKTFSVPEEKITLIHRSVDIAAFTDTAVTQQEKDDFLQKWNIPADKQIILLPGRLSRWKGHLIFLDALKLLKEDKEFQDNWLALIVGGDIDSDYGKTIKHAISAKGLDKKVIMTGASDNIPCVYAVSSCVCVPSTRPEGFGRTIVEAQSMGVPVIASAHGGAIETIAEGKTGWLFRNRDEHQLYRCIKKVLLLSKEERNVYKKAAVNHVKKYFSLENMTGKTIDVYKKYLQD